MRVGFDIALQLPDPTAVVLTLSWRPALTPTIRRAFVSAGIASLLNKVVEGDGHRQPPYRGFTPEISF